MAQILPWRPRIIAHRGGAGSWPGHRENSIEAFLAAAAAGFTSECDVWPSSDGEPVVIHDATLQRVTSIQGNVLDFHSTDLQRIANLSLLSDVSNLVELVEIKPANAKEFVRRVIEIMTGRQWKLIAFDQTNLFHALEIDPTVKAVYLIDVPKGVDVAIAGGWDSYIAHGLLDERTMNRLRDAGLSVGTWTVNTKDDLTRIAPFRPDVIISDVPVMIREWVNHLGNT
jgi:glycerophosphoryl diester phosphodiesterase